MGERREGRRQEAALCNARARVWQVECVCVCCRCRKRVTSIALQQHTHSASHTRVRCAPRPHLTGPLTITPVSLLFLHAHALISLSHSVSERTASSSCFVPIALHCLL